MQVKSKVNVRIFDDTGEKDCLFAPDDVRAEVTNNNHTEQMSGRFVIAASGSLALPFGTVNTVHGIFIRTLTDFELTLDGSATPIVMTKPSGLGTNDPIKFYADASITSATIDNPSATATLVGYYAVWGDAT
jgi:hypothetical protein